MAYEIGGLTGVRVWCMLVGMDYMCPRCKRPTQGWPLVRADVCSPKDWARCIRTPQPGWVSVHDMQAGIGLHIRDTKRDEEEQLHYGLLPTHARTQAQAGRGRGSMSETDYGLDGS